MEENQEAMPRHYQVNVVVLEGRHLAITNAKTKISISIDSKKKYIQAKSNRTDSPYFNDFCTFLFFLPLTVLLDKILIIRVFQISKLVKKSVGKIGLLFCISSTINH